MSAFEPEGFRELFSNGMKRSIPNELPVPPAGNSLNLGSGNAPIKGCINLDPQAKKLHTLGQDLPGEYSWYAPRLNFNEETVSSIHAYHFFEHLSFNLLRVLFNEIARVLRPNGVVYYCVPYAMSPIAFMDASHETFWTEETMRTLLNSRGYESSVSDILKIKFQIIAGITSQNLAVLGALQKQGN